MNALKDKNRVTSLIGVSNADGLTILDMFADPSTHALQIAFFSGTAPLSLDAPRDQDRKPTIVAVSKNDPTKNVVLGVDAGTNALIVEAA